MDADPVFLQWSGCEQRKIGGCCCWWCIDEKNYCESFNLLDEMVANDYKYPKESALMRKTAGVLEVDVVMALTSQVDALVKKLDTREVNSVHIPTPYC